VVPRTTVLLALATVACQAATLPAPTTLPPPRATTVLPATGSGRVEVLNAADAAFGRGDVAAASGLYERVLNTPSTGESATTTAAINDYTHFRDMIALLADSREDDARAQLDALQQSDSQAPFTRLGNQLWDQYGMVGSLRAACAQVQPQIAAQAGATLAALQAAGVEADPRAICSARNSTG
jgi:hypothetical protein